MNPVNLNLGKRLRAARKARGLTQQSAADLLGLTRTAVTQIEAGNRSVSTLELSRLARIYCRPLAYLLETAEGSDADEDLLVALQRVTPVFKRDREVREQTNRCINLCLEGMALKDLMGFSPGSGPPDYQEKVPGNAGEAVFQGERVAEEERSRLGLGKGSIPYMSRLIAAQGIWVSKTSLPNGLSGLFLRHPSIGSVILVNSSHPRVRRRFSYAHEYAHALLDRERDLVVSSTGNSAELVEKRANAFAAAFLMPRDGVLEVLRNLNKGLPSRRGRVIYDVTNGEGVETELRSAARSQRITYRDATMVAHCFGVSYASAVYRLTNLLSMSKEKSRRLLAQEEFGRKYLNMLGDEEDSARVGYEGWTLRDEIAGLAIEAYRRELISRGRVMDLGRSLEVSGEALLDLAEAAREK